MGVIPEIPLNFPRVRGAYVRLGLHPLPVG